MDPISPQPGNAQSARTFVGRVALTRRAEEMLRNGQNLLLTDPRRMGKTQWLRHLQRTTTEFTPIFVNYEAVRTSDELFEKTARALVEIDSLPRKFLDGLRQFVSHIDQVSIAGNSVRTASDDSGAQRLQRVIAHLNREIDGRKPVLLLVDELPLAIRNITQNESPDAARVVLQTLRDARMTAARVRWILCGSIGLHHVIGQCGATQGEVNDLQSIPLGPLEDAEATELAARLLLGAGLSAPADPAVTALATACGRIPFLMHKIALMVSEKSMEAATAAEIEDLFADFLDDRDNSGAVTHFIQRFDMNYGADQTRAMAMLDRVARSPSMPTRELLEGRPDEDAAGLGRIVDLLIDDHYLLEARGVISWRYPVLQRIWSHRRRLA